MTLDYLIFGSYVITMEGPGTGVIPNGAVGVSGNRIVVVPVKKSGHEKYISQIYFFKSGHRSLFCG